MGPNRERAALFTRVLPRDDSTGRLPSVPQLRRTLPAAGTPGPFAALAARTDTIKFSSEQLSLLRTADERYGFGRDSVYDAFAAYVDSVGGSGADHQIQKKWRESIAKVAWLQWDAGQGLSALWTDSAQREVVLRVIGAMPLQSRLYVLSRPELDRWLTQWITSPIR